MKSQTKSTKLSDIKRQWHHFDVKDKVMGRICVEIAHALMGKSKPYYVSHLDCGDYVVVTNAKYVKVTGRKEKEKLYSHYSGYPGGLKQKPLWVVRQEHPAVLIRQAVMGMLPKNKLRDRLITRLNVYPESDHPFGDKVNRKKVKN